MNPTPDTGPKGDGVFAMTSYPKEEVWRWTICIPRDIRKCMTWTMFYYRQNSLELTEMRRHGPHAKFVENYTKY